MNDDSSSPDGSGKSLLERLTTRLRHPPRNRDELMHALRLAEIEGVLDADAVAMVEGALRVGDSHVRDVMVPRSQMVVIHREKSFDEVLDMVVETGHSRFPVIGEDKDQVMGILLAKDLLRHYREPDAHPELESLLRPPVMIPESKRLNVLLREFRVSRNHMAIVVDEYGGVSGLVTIEDVLEEIVGEIDDEHDVEEAQAIRRAGQNRWLVQALTPIEEFNAVFGTDLPEEEFDTVGGLVVAEFGRLPERDESVTISELEFTVLKADTRRIHLLQVKGE